jgi:pimeloyl-ACP methyl ester carboxylesterase
MRRSDPTNNVLPRWATILLGALPGGGTTATLVVLAVINSRNGRIQRRRRRHRGVRLESLSFAAMADDVAALIKQLGNARADVMGYSLGGGVALQTAIRHPGSVRKLVVLSQPFRRDGWYPEVLVGMAQMGPAAAEGN